MMIMSQKGEHKWETNWWQSHLHTICKVDSTAVEWIHWIHDNDNAHSGRQ